MLERQQRNFFLTGFRPFVSEGNLAGLAPRQDGLPAPGHGLAAVARILSSDESSESKDVDPELEDAARSERDYVRQRLRDELQREPTEQEVDEWLRQHTEGY